MAAAGGMNWLRCSVKINGQKKAATKVVAARSLFSGSLDLYDYCLMNLVIIFFLPAIITSRW
jgi:hypothetical protein